MMESNRPLNTGSSQGKLPHCKAALRTDRSIAKSRPTLEFRRSQVLPTYRQAHGGHWNRLSVRIPCKAHSRVKPPGLPVIEKLGTYGSVDAGNDMIEYQQR